MRTYRHNKLLKSSILNRLRKTAKRYVENTDGIAATEMAFIVPVAMLLVVGMADAFNAFSTKRALSNVNSTIGDLLSRPLTPLTGSQTRTILAAADDVFAPRSGVTVSVVSYQVAAGGVMVPLWSGTFSGNNANTAQLVGAGTGCGNAPQVAANVANGLNPGDGVVMAQSCITWTPIFGELFGHTTLGNIDMVSTISHTARNGNAVQCPTC